MKGIILVLILVLICYINSSLILNLTDSDFDTQTRNGQFKPWLVMFYVTECSYCKKGKQILEKTAILSNKDENRINFGKVECNENMYSCLRFNVTKVPTVIIIEKGYYFEETNYLTENSLMNLIKNERVLEKGKELPPAFGWLQFSMRSIQETMFQINRYMKNFMKTKFDINIEWNNTHSIFLFGIAFIIIFATEFYVLSYFLGKKKDVKPKPSENLKSEVSNESEGKISEELKKESLESCDEKKKTE